MQLKITQIKYINVIFFISIIIGYQFDGTGYSNIYAINKISNQSLIKLPFRLLSYDLSISDITENDNFSIKANWGIEHKINNFNSKNSLPSMIYDLISIQNVEYSSEFRELYFIFENSVSEMRFGKQLHTWGAADANSPLDFLNPTDYYYLFTDSDETKIGKLSFLFDLYFEDQYKFQFLVMPNHKPNNIPLNDPDFPITLPATVKNYQFLNDSKKPEIGAYIQKSGINMDWTLYYFSGYDRNYNLYGANVFLDQFDINSVTDTIFSFRKTDMIAFSNVSFIDDLTLRTDFAYFKTESASQSIEDRLYSGQDILSGTSLEFETLAATSYFNISAEYYQYCFQLEYGLPLDINFTGQIFGYVKEKVEGNVVDIALTNFEIYLDGKDFFYPGLGSPLATLAKEALVLNLDKTFIDDLLEIQFVSLIDLNHQGKLFQLKFSYDIIDDLNASILFYKGIGDKSAYPDNLETDTVDESLLYPFNGMENFSHIRAQLKYYF